MPSRNVCIYDGCKNSRRTNPALSFHRFPQNEQTRLEWIARTGNTSKNLSNGQVNDARICSEHFSDSDFISYGNNGKRTIQAGALPIDVDLSRRHISCHTGNEAGINLVLADGIVSSIPITDSTKPPNNSATACGPRSDITIVSVSAVVPPIRIVSASSSSPALTQISNPLISAETCPTKTFVHPVFPPTCDSPALPATSVPVENLTSESISIAASDNLTDSCPNLAVPNITRVPSPTRPPTTSHSSVRPAHTSSLSRRKTPRIVTSKEAELSRLVNVLRSQIKIKNQKIKRMEAALENVAHHIKFAKAICEGFNESQLAFVHMQLNHVKHKKWSEEEKQFALSLFYRSPKAYVFLRDNQKFALPCVTLIRQWINELNLSPGISTTVIEALSIKSELMTTEERQCVLMWDEMSIRRMLEYNPKADLVEGFQDLGDLGRTNECANYALVFMLRGLKFTWKQPVSYVISHGNVRHGDLVKLLLAVIDAIFSTGLIIKFLVCDQGSSNRTALTSLGVTEFKPFIERGGHKIFFGFDIPHLVKSTRNNLINRDFIIDKDVISWGVIRELRDVERNRSCKAAPKLTDRHVNPNNFQKMSVSLATQVYSHTVSAAINTGKVTGDLKHPNCIATANFVKRMNDLFDCLNSRTPSDSNPLKRALSSLQPQVEKYLRNSLSWLEKWTVSSGLSPPCFEGMRLTVRSVLLLWEDLRNEGCMYLITSRLNQDPLENLFAVMRYRSGHNDNPSAMGFRRNLQYAMTANLMKPSASTNCELDDTTTLLAAEMNSARKNLNVDEIRIVSENVGICLDEPTDDSIVEEGENENFEESGQNFNVTSLEECSIRYVTGYLAHKCLLHFDCKACEHSLTRGHQYFEQTNDLLIFWRAFKNNEDHEMGNLQVPSDEFHAVALTAYKAFESKFTADCHAKDLTKNLEAWVNKAIVRNHIDFWSIDGECAIHREWIVKLFVRVHVFNRLKWISRDMRDCVKSKRSAGSTSLKPNRKLQKVTHQ